MFLSIKSFTQPALSYLMFSLPLTKSSQQCKTARHCRTPMKSNIVILILRSKNTIVFRVAESEIKCPTPNPDSDFPKLPTPYSDSELPKFPTPTAAFPKFPTLTPNSELLNIKGMKSGC